MAIVNYVVKIGFRDAKDKQKPYFAGDKYPRPASKKVAKVRIKQLIADGVITEVK